MKCFLNSRTNRSTATLVLIAWLFALASGIANACLLEAPRGTHPHAAGVAESLHAHAPALAQPPGHAAVIESDSEQSSAAEALCHDACDDRTNSVPKQTASLAPPHLARLVVIAIIWLATQPAVSAIGLARDNHADPFGIPIRVRYARLTL